MGRLDSCRKLAELPWSFDAMAPVRRAWEELGADEARFQGYWNNRQWLRFAPAGVPVSAYLKPGGERLLVVVNTTEAPVEGALCLVGAIAAARDSLANQPVEVADGAIQGRFLPRRLNMLWVKPAAP